MKLLCVVLTLASVFSASGFIAGKEAEFHFKPTGSISKPLSSIGSTSPFNPFLDKLVAKSGYSSFSSPEGSADKSGLENIGITIIDPKDAHHHKRDTVLFDKKDLVPWLVFTLSFFILVIFDNAVLHRKAEKLSLSQALLYTTFWVSCAGAFNFYVYLTRGADDAFSWGTGYLLEWMLSVDNLFVFHRVFELFKTPDEQKHKPLFYGIMGAIIFRMIFFLIEELLMHHVWWVHIVFGLFLIYTGIKAVAMDEDDNPTEGWLFQKVIERIDYVDRYDDEGRFFTPVELPRDPEASPEEQPVVKYKATRLMLVVICLEITDVIFAVDSVSAIVAQIPDLFLAYTACVFAMLGLRALFFAIHELVKMFTMLAYGVAFILVFLGIKLITKSWIHFSPKFVCFILVGTIGLSIAASLVNDRLFLVTDEAEIERKQSSRESTGRKRSARAQKCVITQFAERSLTEIHGADKEEPPKSEKFARLSSPGETGSTRSCESISETAKRAASPAEASSEIVTVQAEAAGVASTGTEAGPAPRTPSGRYAYQSELPTQA